jgi:surfeit locus 1 family protein
VSRFRPGIGLTLAVLPVMALLTGLGIWQLQRLGWKTDLLARIETRVHEAPVVLPAEPDPQAFDFRPLTVGGRFRHDRAMLVLARPRMGRAGYEVVTPLERPDGPPVLVNRGFLAMERKDAAGQGPFGETTVMGLARVPPPPGLFQPANRPDAAVWNRVDPAAMGSRAGYDAVVPVVVEVFPVPGEPEGVEPRVDLPNNHAQYAATWFALAAVLATVYGLMGFRRAGR